MTSSSNPIKGTRQRKRGKGRCLLHGCRGVVSPCAGSGGSPGATEKARKKRPKKTRVSERLRSSPQWKQQVPNPRQGTPPIPASQRNAEAAFQLRRFFMLHVRTEENIRASPYREAADAEAMGLSVARAAYSYSTTSAHFSSSSRSSGLPLRDWLAATMGIHFCTYCLAVSLFLQKRLRYFSASSCRPSRENSR